MPTYDKSTYAQLTDDVREDINESKLAEKSNTSIQNDILRAEQIIADDYDVHEEYELRLSANVDEYAIQDRPVITNVTNATPMSVKSKSAHGLVDKDIISIRGVQGNDAANGTFRARYTDTTNFTLETFARITGVTVSGTTVTATTEKAHGWSTGYSIVIDGSSAYIDGTFTITVTGLKTFTFTHTVPAGTYDGLGIASRNAVGGGAYISGGRFWKENEIPSHLGRFDFGEGDVNGFSHRVDFVGSGEIVDAQGWEWNDFGFTPYGPCQAAHGRKNGRRYIRFHPVPLIAETIRIYGILKIAPHLYFDDLESSEIHLDSEWNEAMKFYVKSLCYKWLKDKQSERDEMNNFKAFMRDKKLNTVTHSRIRVEYS